MIDPLKATKGRRMSTQSRKKSSKTSRLGRSGPAAKSKAATKARTGKVKAGKTRPAAAAAKTTAAKTAAAKTAAARTAAARTAAKSTAKRVKSAAPAPKSRESRAAAPVPATGVAEGAKAPDFHLPRDGGGTVSLADYAGRKLVLFFYPRANTPGCTKEAIDFTRLSRDFASNGTAVLGVSADTVKAQDNFRDKHQLSVPLISDERHEMLEAYGAWGEKTLYGRKFFGIIRTTVLIGADGRIAKIWRHVKVDGHADQVLAAAQEI
jgi:peroxiredoxin Q/BCP